MYHDAVQRHPELVLDFSDCYYIDPEGLRWLASVKSAQHVTFVDRRSGTERRAQDRRAPSGDTRAAGQRRGKPDRRQRSEF